MSLRTILAEEGLLRYYETAPLDPKARGILDQARREIAQGKRTLDSANLKLQNHRPRHDASSYCEKALKKIDGILR